MHVGNYIEVSMDIPIKRLVLYSMIGLVVAAFYVYYALRPNPTLPSFLGAIDLPNAQDNSAEELAAQDRRHAVELCTKLIKRRVKTPSTVKFVSPLMGDTYTEYRPPTFPVNTRIIGMEFDAQNLHGALVRYRGECNFKVAATDWTVNYVNIDAL